MKRRTLLTTTVAGRAESSTFTTNGYAVSKWHQPMAEAMSKFGREIYDIAQGRVK